MTKNINFINKKLDYFVYDTCKICNKKNRIYFENEQDKIKFEIDKSNSNLELFICPKCNEQQSKNDDQSLNKFLLAMIDHQLSGEKEENEKEHNIKQ